MGGIKVPAPPKPKHCKSPNYFFAPSADLLTKSGVLPGDIGIVNGKVYLYTGNKWTKCHAPESKSEKITIDLECKSCGSRSFIDEHNGWFKCEYCGSRYHIE